jgi:DNA-binding transcriptional LysR family regulator
MTSKRFAMCCRQPVCSLALPPDGRRIPDRTQRFVARLGRGQADVAQHMWVKIQQMLARVVQRQGCAQTRKQAGLADVAGVKACAYKHDNPLFCVMISYFQSPILMLIAGYDTFVKQLLLNKVITRCDMLRNLDLSALRSFLAIADVGGVTRAAASLNLTQSAVSMQIKRLEEVLQVQLLDRSARRVALTASGEQLAGYARQMLALNDEALARLTHSEFDGMITLGVPHDIVFPVIPAVLRQFARAYPRVRTQLVSSFTAVLIDQFARGEFDMILTTEDSVGPDGTTLAVLPLVWMGAPGGHAWKQRPLPLAYEHRCGFRQGVQAALDRQGIAWTMAVQSDSSRAIEASVQADLAVHTVLAGTEAAGFERIAHGGALAALPTKCVNLYVNATAARRPHLALADLIRDGYTTRSHAVQVA